MEPEHTPAPAPAPAPAPKAYCGEHLSMTSPSVTCVDDKQRVDLLPKRMEASSLYWMAQSST